MALSPRLEVRQTQSLVMTPQLMQAIRLLQLSNLDVATFVETELERNPMLERADGEPGETPEPETPPERTDDHSLPEPDDAPAADLSNDFPDDHPPAAEEAPPSLPDETWSAPGMGQTVAGGDYNLEAFVASETTLADHLNAQVGLALSDAGDRLIGHAIVGEIDETGYLRTDTPTLADRLGAATDDVERVLSTVQAFDPSGIGARNLAECLAIQLRERDRFDPAMRALTEHLDLVARRDLNRLRSLCGVTQDDLADMLTELKSLNPKPGNAFGGGPARLAVPDVTVRPSPDGGWQVDLNQETLPRLLVNEQYRVQVSAGRRSDADRTYINECMQAANWLVKSLDQRARTILNVTAEIVRQQDAFLVHGVQHLRPLNLKTIADAIDMHESTVSRVTSNKYVATPRGIFELKYFFTAAIPAANGGEAHSAEAVRDRIRRLIDGERPDGVLSDDAIVRLLGQSGVDIARRTVAKYREAMRIASSVQRRREKQAAM